MRPSAPRAALSIAAAAALWVSNSERNPAHTFPGLLDEVRIWDRARSAAAIQATMDEKLGNAYTASPDSGLVVLR